MATLIMNRGPDPFRHYWRVFFALILSVAGLSCWPLLTQTARGPVVGDKDLSAKEQSLSVLGAPRQQLSGQLSSQMFAREPGASEPSEKTPAVQANPQTASSTSEESGPYAHKTKDIYSPESALYQSPSGVPGSPAGSASSRLSDQKPGPGGAESGGSLAAALANVANAGKKPEARAINNGYTSQSGFSAPRANFGALNGLGSNGRSSPASYEAPATPFGIGKSNPEIVTTVGGGGGSSALGAPRAHSGSSQSLNALEDARAQATSAAWSANSEGASGLSGRSYDMSSPRPDLHVRDPRSGVMLDGNVGPVANLKQNDPNLDKKEIQPPAPADVKPVGGNSQMFGMIMQIAMMGLMGPLLKSFLPFGGG